MWAAMLDVDVFPATLLTFFFFLAGSSDRLCEAALYRYRVVTPGHILLADIPI